jgi:hypothetical protein
MDAPSNAEIEVERATPLLTERDSKSKQEVTRHSSQRNASQNCRPLCSRKQARQQSKQTAIGSKP